MAGGRGETVGEDKMAPTQREGLHQRVDAAALNPTAASPPAPGCCVWVFSSNALGKQTPHSGKKTQKKTTLKHVRIPNLDCCSFYMSMSFEQMNAFIREITTGAPSLLWLSSNLASPPSVPSGPFSDQLMITRPCTPLCAY